jgi:hypothetical protein
MEVFNELATVYAAKFKIQPRVKGSQLQTRFHTV